MAAEAEQAQCHAITEDGTRCERPAGEDGFCHQHDESDETVDDRDETSGDEVNRSDGGEETDGSEPPDALDDVRAVRETVASIAPDVIGREMDGIIEIDGRDEGWRAVVEVVERRAVPDTQDILGRYEIDLADGAVTGYRRIDRYRRGDTAARDAL